MRAGEAAEKTEAGNRSVKSGGDGSGRCVWRLLAAAGVVALCASLVGNVLLVRAAERYYGRASAIRLDPVGLDVFAKDRGAAPPPRDKPVLVLFGDSRAAMWGDLPDLGDYHVVNRGIGWQTTAQILLRARADVAALHPTVVVLEAGVNDLKTIAEFPDRRAEIVSRCEDNLRTIVDICRAADTTVVVVSVFRIGHVALWRRPFWSSDVEAAVLEVNAFLKTLVSDKTLLLDADQALDDESGAVRTAYQIDHLHLKPAGYDALDGRLFPMVRSLHARAPLE